MNDSTGAMDVELQPGNPNTVYAWMNRIERKPWTIISGSRAGGFFKSTDGGETWAQGGAGLPSELIGKGNLAVTAANPQRIYALVEALPGGGLYRVRQRRCELAAGEQHAGADAASVLLHDAGRRSDQRRCGVRRRGSRSTSRWMAARR